MNKPVLWAILMLVLVAAINEVAPLMGVSAEWTAVMAIGGVALVFFITLINHDAEYRAAVVMSVALIIMAFFPSVTFSIVVVAIIVGLATLASYAMERTDVPFGRAVVVSLASAFAVVLIFELGSWLVIPSVVVIFVTNSKVTPVLASS